MDKLTYVTDRKRHLICVPYSVENLHRMAKDLNIGRHFFHFKNKKGKLRPHYDIPAKRIKEIEDKCTIVLPENIVEIIRHPEYAETIIGPEIKGNAIPCDQFLRTQIEYNGE